MFQVRLTTCLWLFLAFACCAGIEVGNQTAFAHLWVVPQDVPADTVITLMRTDCYGGCPTYTLTINADGKVIYQGGHDVKQKGKVESSITREKLKELIAAFKEINYFDLQGRYNSKSEACPSFSFDAPSVITSLTLNEKKKTINHNTGCSGSKELAQLTWLERKIDEAVNAKQWIE
jgi:Domain of unknown function (DUF6438)